jgi:hypothetical protein
VIEKRTDMHISTMRRSIEAMGGKLSLIAEFPDRVPVVLTGIGQILKRPPKKWPICAETLPCPFYTLRMESFRKRKFKHDKKIGLQ